MQLSVEYHKYQDKVHNVWLNCGFWNKQSVYNEHFNNLQSENVYCLEKTRKNSYDVFPLLEWFELI